MQIPDKIEIEKIKIKIFWNRNSLINMKTNNKKIFMNFENQE